MKRTTSNAERVIATTGSEHRAMSRAPDVCLVPGQGPQPFDNWIDSDKLANGATTTTFVADESIWTECGELGPPSEPAHEGVNGGVSSGTYRGVAYASSYSRDVFFEGGAAVRADDTTGQNDGNGHAFRDQLHAPLSRLTTLQASRD